jgi:hypothetical protein
MRKREKRAASTAAVGAGSFLELSAGHATTRGSEERRGHDASSLHRNLRGKFAIVITFLLRNDFFFSLKRDDYYYFVSLLSDAWRRL